MSIVDADVQTPKALLGPEGESGDEGEGGTYWTTDQEVLDAIAERRGMAARKQDDWRKNASEAFAFVAGEQYSEEDRKFWEDAKKPLVTFNRVGPIVNAVCGQQICNRQETRFLPRETTDMLAAEVWSKVVSWAREQCDAEDEESDSFRDLVVTGMGWTCTTVEYDEDPSGMIREQRVDCRRFRWDPASRKKNIADSRWVQCDYWYDEDEIEEKWPGSEPDISPQARFNSDAKPMPHDATNAWRYEKDYQGYDEIEGKYRCIHEIHFRLEDTYQIPDGGQVTQLNEQEWTQLQARLKQIGLPAPRVAKTKSRIYYEAWVCGNTVLYKGKYPTKTGFEYQCMTGLRDEEGQWYGLVLPLMDPQRFANKTFTQIVRILDANAKGGLVAEKGAVDNTAKFEMEWSKSDGVSWVNDGAVTGGKIMPKPPPQIPAELTKLLEYSISGMREVTGANVEFLGQTEKVQPGVVEAMRTKAGLVILAPWFDAMRLYMKRQGRLLGEYIYTYISDGRWVRISGLDTDLQRMQPAQPPMQGPQGMMSAQAGPVPPMPPPGMPGMGGMPMIPGQQRSTFPMSPPQPGGIQYVQLIKNPDVLKFDLVVDESTQSRDSRERYFTALLTIVPMAMQAGVPVPPEVIEYAPIPEVLRAKWLDLIRRQQAQAQNQPPLPVMIEQMRGQNAKEIQNMKNQADQQSKYMDTQFKQMQESGKAQVEAAKQQYQAQSQEIVDRSRLHMDAVMGALDQKREQDKMLLDARLNAFEVLLKAVVDMRVGAVQAATQVATRPKGNGKDGGGATQPALSDVMPQLTQLLEGQQALTKLMQALAGGTQGVQ